jgi:hypothetical protein
MINELLKMKNSLDSWGIEIEDAKWHPSLKSNSQIENPNAFIIKTYNDGAIEINEFNGYKEMRYCPKGNSSSGLTFKFNNTNKSQVSRVRNSINRTIELAKRVGDNNPSLKVLSALAKNLEKIDAEKLAEQLKSYIDEIDKKYAYFGFDVDGDFPNNVQDNSCMSAINDRLFELDKETEQSGTGTDFFGNNDFGYEDKLGLKIKVKYETPLYSKCVDNRCYEKFGMKSTEACKIGNKTRKKLSKILQWCFSEDKKNKLWFEYTPSSSKGRTKEPYKYFIVSSLAPNNPSVLNGDVEEIPYMAWEEQVSALIKQLTEQSLSNPDTKSSVFVLQVPTNGAWCVKYSKDWDADVVANQTKLWHEGINNCTSRSVPRGTFLPPTIRHFLNSINNKWSYKSGDIIREKTYSISPWDVYELFFEDKRTIKKILKVFSTFHVPMLLQSMNGRTKSYPYQINWLVPIRNIILHKLGIYKEKFMEHWAYCMGQLFREANSIHREYFATRKMKPPDTLVGDKFIRMALDNPRRAYGNFTKAFSLYLNWASRRTGKFSVAHANKMAQQIGELTEGNLLSVASDKDRILLYTGFASFVNKKREVEIKEIKNNPLIGDLK